MVESLRFRRHRRHSLAWGAGLLCQTCAWRSGFAQYLPSGAAPRTSPRATVAPACGFNKNSPEDPAVVKLISRSGNAELDRHMPQERRVLNDLFWVEPEFGFYEDGSLPNAISLREGEKVRIGLGLNLLRDEIVRKPEGWQSAIIGILAHEWAHAYQYSTNLVEKCHLWETHADYLAGWYLGNKVAMGLARIDIDVFAGTLFRMGAKSGFFNPDDYGQPATRVDAMRAGFRLGHRSFSPRKRPDLLGAVQDGYAFAEHASR